jgi:transposase
MDRLLPPPAEDSLQRLYRINRRSSHGYHHTALASIGIDNGKEVFHVVGMDACLSAHFVSRALRQLGHEPRIIPAIYVSRS